MLVDAPEQERRAARPTRRDVDLVVASDFRILEKGRSVASGPIEALTDRVVENHLSV